MGEMKIIIEDEIEQSFRHSAMKEFGFTRGSISNAAEQAIKEWVERHERIQKIDDPVEAISGMLKHVKKNSVELQHESSKIRSQRYVNRRKYFH